MMFAFAGLLTYANLRQASPTERIEPVQLSSFVFDKSLSNTERTQLENAVMTLEGITAFTISKEGNSASAVYRMSQLTEGDLAAFIGRTASRHASVKDLQASGTGCPVHAVGAAFGRMLTTLDFRN